MVYIVLCNYFSNGFFGIYSSVLNARKAISDFFNTNPFFITWAEEEGYKYRFIDNNNRNYKIEITYATIDE